MVDQAVAWGSSVASDDEGIGLCSWGEHDRLNAYVGWAGGGPNDGVGYVLRLERINILISFGRAFFVAAKTDPAEIGFDHAGIDGGDADGGSVYVDAKTV
jgi:hypothetical protein